MQVTKLSMRVIVNHLNEALFLRTEDGQLGYCNELAAKILYQGSKHLFDSDSQIKNYLNCLGSSDILLQNQFSQNKTDKKKVNHD